MLKIPSGLRVAADTEGTGLEVWAGDTAFAFSFCNTEGETGYCQWDVDPMTRRVIPNKKELRELREWFAEPSITKVFHNADYDMRSMYNGHGIVVRGQIEDTGLKAHCAYTCEIGGKAPYGLKGLSKKYAGIDDDDEKDLKKKVISARLKAKKKGWKIHESVEADYWLLRALDPESRECETYAVRDAERTIILDMFYEDLFDKEPDLRAAYEFEIRVLFPIIYRMEGRGLRIRPNVIREQIAAFSAQRERNLATLRRVTGREDFEPGSHADLKWFLFDKLKLKPKHMTKPSKTYPNGQPSTNKDSIGLYKDAHPEVESLFDYREADQAISSFFTPYDRAKVKEGPMWVVHPNIKQGGKKTGRLSCENPNLQGTADEEGGRGESNIPARKPFGPRPGFAWFLYDYNQLEVRTFAAASRYDLLIDILRSGRDLHTEATNGIWGGRDNSRAIRAACAALGTRDSAEAERWLASYGYDIVKAEASLDKKTSRNKGKPFFFTRMFGGGKNSISKKLECSLEEADELVRSYDRTLPGVIGFVRKAANIAYKTGQVKTLYGRVLHMPPGFEYKASPYIVQGTAADLVKRAMVDTDAYLCRAGFTGHHEYGYGCPSRYYYGGLLLQIHDELLFELPIDVPMRVLRALKALMESQERNIRLEVPVSVKRVSKYWSEPEKLDL